MLTAECAPYARFANYYDRLGWSEFSEIVYPWVNKFIIGQKTRPRNFLDLACGTGTLAFKLTEQKIKVTGVDISPEMIKVASEKLSSNGCAPEFVLGDITDFNLDRKFDMAGCFFDSINHLNSKTDIKNAFKCAAAHLIDGGWYLFDMVTRMGLENWHDYYNTQKDSYYVAQEARFNSKKDTATVKIEAFINDGSNGTVHIKEVFNEICIPLEQTYKYLADAGFSKTIMKPFPPAQAIENADRIMIYARK